MARIHGRNGIVYLSASFGAPASPLSFASDWTMSFAAARADISPVGDTGATYVSLPPDISGDFTGFYDDATSQAYLSAIDGLPRTFYLYPDGSRPYKFFYGTILPDFTAAAGIEAAATAKATWSAAGQIQRSPLGAVVTLLGQDGTFGTLAAVRFTSSGHTFFCQPVPGWQFGKGVAVFYSRATPDGQIVLSTLPLTENELQPTADHAEICVYNPAGPSFTRQVIPTSAGALTAVSPSTGLGGTDVGAGDIALVTVGGQQMILLACQGYYFGWSIPVTGLYPTLAYLAESAGTWSYDQAASLTGDQWESTNPSLFGSVVAPNGQASGNGANYWSPRFPGQMAVLPDGNVVIGHYFGFGGAGSISGGISVVSPSGTLLAAYQIPNMTPATGTLTFAAARDVEADPAGDPAGVQCFAIIYDAFGTGIHATIQVFSYNHATMTIAPVSVPCVPGDTGIVPQFCLFGPDGTLYVSCGQASNGLVAGNLQAYLKHGTGWNLTSQAPVFSGWQASSWPTPVAADYSLGFARQLGGLAGPMAADPVTGALLVPGGNGRLGAAIPSPGITSLGPNLLSAFNSGFEPPQLLTADDATFATSLGSWVAFLGSETRITSPPVAPPAGTAAMKMLEAFGSSIYNTAFYVVNPSTTYQFQAYFLAGTTSRTCQIYIQWQTSSGTVISDSAMASATDATGSWTAAKLVAASPSNAGRAVLFAQVNSAAAGEAHYLAANSLYSLAPTGWSGFFAGLVITSAQAYAGSFSLAISADFNSETLLASSPPVAVTPLAEYFATARFRSAAAAQQCQVQISWRDGTGATISVSACTLTVTDSSSGWVVAACGAMAPAGSVTAVVGLLIVTSTIGETHYADQVTMQAQPFTAIPYADFELAALRTLMNSSVGLGRPSIAGRSLYLPLSVPFTAAESAAYNAGGYVPAYKPQFLAAIDLAQLLGQ